MQTHQRPLKHVYFFNSIFINIIRFCIRHEKNRISFHLKLQTKYIIILKGKKKKLNQIGDNRNSIVGTEFYLLQGMEMKYHYRIRIVERAVVLLLDDFYSQLCNSGLEIV